MSSYTNEVVNRERFEFGKNWSHFLSNLNQDRIALGEASLRQMLELESLRGKRFLDIGSGSGLFSLAARRLGAKVHSFDFDPHSVACTNELRRRYFPDDNDWKVEEGSALDRDYMASLGEFDIVYSWGVLHHTGDMWRALENACLPVAPSGRLFIAIYNDMGTQSKRWRRIKRIYNQLPAYLRIPFVLTVIAPAEGKALMGSLITLSPQKYVHRWTRYDGRRGMSYWRDIIDWVGGYPYEVASPDQIFDFFKTKGFELIRLKAGGVGIGCNEFVFCRAREKA